MILDRQPAWRCSTGAVLLGLMGCGQVPPPAKSPGAREVAQRFYEGLIKRDWAAAYAALMPESQRACTREQFAGRAESYLRQLSFQPMAVQFTACAERGDEAIAHVVLTGRDQGKRRRFRDALSL